MMLASCIILLINLQIIWCENIESCKNQRTCSQCIQQFGCAWCPTLNNSTDHCVDKISATCADVVSPKSLLAITKDEPLSQNLNAPVTLKPQRFSIELRRNEEFKLNFEYEQSPDFPMDLYILMDMSVSMREHKKVLGEVGVKMSNTIRNLTRNFRLGFGSFVDKPVPPYLIPNGDYRGVAFPYSFKNHLSLTEDYHKFNERVLNTELSKNYDFPEGGLDAMIQAMVCTDEIKWRKNATKLLVLCTDSISHLAGEGKLAGIVEPNDGECHMRNDEYETEASLKYDYPSLSQLNYISERENINLLFAITNNYVIGEYENWSPILKKANVGELKADSKQIIDFIVNNYNRIVGSLKMSTNATSDVDVKFDTDCPHKIDNGCENLEKNQIVQFTATIKATECSTSGENTKYISFKPQSVTEEIVVELKIICDCDCEESDYPTVVNNSIKCTQHGDEKCGVCVCHPGYYGNTCECTGTSTRFGDVTGCQASTNDSICSDLGTCDCGECRCVTYDDERKVWGKFCQCNNYDCEKSITGKLCSGNGKCECNKCVCQSGWAGDACDCSLSNDTCIFRPTRKLCSEHGTCQCGKCLCEAGRSGHYCEDCDSCPSLRCDELAPCVECLTDLETDNKNCTTECIEYGTNMFDKVDEFTVPGKSCMIQDKDGCTINYQYRYDDEKLILDISKERTLCPVNIYALIGAVVGTMLLAGLVMLLIWKLLTSVHDKREYSKFIKEQSSMKWGRDDNPLYKNPSNTFQNPAFGRRSMRLSSS